MPDRADETDETDRTDRAPREPTRTRFRRIRALAARHVRPPQSVRGFVIAVIVVGAIGSAVGIGGLSFQKFSETEGFCSQCHVMAPEVAAHKVGVHRDVSCGECHVAPSLLGVVKSKIRGAVQLAEVITDTYPKPIPEPEPDLLPPPQETCMKCHPLSEIAKEESLKLVLHSRYREDEANTREMVAVVARPYRLDEGSASRGVHWHVEVQVEYASPAGNEQKIDWIRVKYKNGQTEQFIARSQVTVSSDVQADIDRVLHTEKVHEMTCITCHNRVGHEFPSPTEAVDEAVADGSISQSLPYIVREGVARLSKRYSSYGEADKAIEGIRGVYASRYPLVSRTRKAEINHAVSKLKTLYRLVADPEMNMVSADYPNDETMAGCMRCHDGAHYEVASDGRLMSNTIPWECTTCHTFPQVGSKLTSIDLLSPPPEKQAKTWIFEHGRSPEALEPGAANNSSCTSCHSTGAVRVDLEEMVFNHPKLIEEFGLQLCGYCHTEAFCSRCHKMQALGLGEDVTKSWEPE